MDLELLDRTLAAHGEPRFRARQVWEWTARGVAGYERDDQPARSRCARRWRGRFRSRASSWAARRTRATAPSRRCSRPPTGGALEAVLMRYRTLRRWRRPALDLPLLAVGVPADVHVLRDRPDALRAQPDGLGDPRPGAALPPRRGRRPLRLHGHGRADAEPRRGARRVRAAARPRHHPPAHDDLDGRLDPRDRAPGRVRHAAAPGALRCTQPRTRCARS